MVDFSFNGLFKPISKGIPDTSNLPASYSLDIAYYIMSLFLEILFLILFIILFLMSVYRSWKKIKNRKFNTFAKKQEEASEEIGQKSQADKNTNDNLVYRFDEQDHEKQNEDGEQNSIEKESEEEERYQQDEDVDQKQQFQERFLKIDQKLTLFQPFLIGPIVSTLVFAFNYISFIFMAISVVLFIIFNLKGILSQYRILTEIYVIPSILAFLSFYINDHDPTT